MNETHGISHHFNKKYADAIGLDVFINSRKLDILGREYLPYTLFYFDTMLVEHAFSMVCFRRMFSTFLKGQHVEH